MLRKSTYYSRLLGSCGRPSACDNARVADRPQMKMFSLRVEEADVEALDDLCERIPTMTKSVIARAALRLGILALREDPGRVVVAPPEVEG